MTGKELYPGGNAVRSVSMQLHISGLEEKLWSMRSLFLQALEPAGYANLTSKKPCVAIRQFLKRGEPFQLIKNMLDNITWKKDEKFDK